MTGWDQHLAPLLDARYPALLAYARVLTAGDQGAAEDLVHDAVVRTFARGRGFADIHHAENYVRKAMTSALVDGYRRNARTIKAFARVAERAHGPSPEASIVPATDIERALALLSARERACVVLRHYDDLTIAGIAARLGLAEGSVKRYLSDASSKLAAALGDSGIDANDPGHHSHLVPVTSTGDQP